MTFARGLSTNLGISGTVRGRAIGAIQYALVWEQEQGEDLNGDFDQDDRIGYIVDLESATSTNLRVAGSGILVAPHLAAVRVDEREQGIDASGDGDRDDEILQRVRPA